MATNNIVIVTQQCYIVCSGIHYITIDKVDKEYEEESIFLKRIKKSKKTSTQARQKPLDIYTINIQYIPVNPNTAAAVNGSGFSSSSRRSEEDGSLVTIKVAGKKECMSLFKDMVDQIRNQTPDHLYLDKLVENFLQENKS